MSDATRKEAVQWCLDNDVAFGKPIFPPPEGWMWASDNDNKKFLLTAIFTNTDDEDIRAMDPVRTLMNKWIEETEASLVKDKTLLENGNQGA